MAVSKKHAAGYTLIELLAVLAIASTLLVVAIPMFRTQIQNSRMTAAATDLLGTFMSAKAQAIGRSDLVTVCISNEDADDCATSGQWEDGWLTFVDSDGNANVDGAEEIIQIHPALAEQLTVRTLAAETGDGSLQNSVTYRPNGLTDLSGTKRLIICNSLGYGVPVRVLIVSMLGKASILKDEDTADTTEEDECPSD